MMCLPNVQKSVVAVAKHAPKSALSQCFPSGQREKAIRVYAIIDDQSNRSLMRSKFFDVLNVDCDGSITSKLVLGSPKRQGGEHMGFK